MFPDTNSLVLPFHKVVFWTQHTVIFVLPFYYALTKRFALDNSDTYYWLLGVSTSGIFIWNVELLVSLATSININYTLWPPPVSPVSGPHYRSLLSLIIGTFFTLNGFFTPKLLQSLVDLWAPQKQAKQTRSKKFQQGLAQLLAKKKQNAQKQRAG